MVAEKEAILEQKAREFVPTAEAELTAKLTVFKEKAEKRASVLEKNDRQQLLEQKQFIESQIGNIRADLASVFGELNTKLESEKAEGVRQIREISKDYLSINEKTGTKTVWHSYRVSDSKWYNPFSWGRSHVERYSTNEHYSYCLASDAVENIRKFSVDAVNQVEKVFSDALQLKELKRKLLDVVLHNFDMGSEKYDASLFRIMVEETISQIEFPVFSIEISDSMNSIAAKFTGELTSAGQKTELSVALSNAISRIYDELRQKLTSAVSEFKTKMNAVSHDAEQQLLQNIMDEFETLLEQFDHKEKEIEGYKNYIVALEEELLKI